MLQELLDAGGTKKGEYTKEAWVVIRPVSPAIGEATAKVAVEHKITMHFQKMHRPGDNKSVSLTSYFGAEEMTDFLRAVREEFYKNQDQYKIPRVR
jgi:hypothetical protein